MQRFGGVTVRNLVYTVPFVAPLSNAGLGFLLLLNHIMPLSAPYVQLPGDSDTLIMCCKIAF